MVELDGDMNRDDDCENVGLGCALEYFSEAEEVMAMIDNIKNIYNTNEFEVQYSKFYDILKQYYEQPHLIDPHLDKILGKFMSIIKDKNTSDELKKAAFDYMYPVIRVRGYKVVVRHLPHEVSDLLAVLTFLEDQDPNDKETWRTRFVLLLWLSIIVIIPFHMSRMDGFTPQQQEEAGSSKKLTVMERIFNICKTYALAKDACAEAGAYLTSKFLTRSDVKEMYMEAFFKWSCDLHSDLNKEGTVHYGVLAAVAAVLKHGKRDDLLPYAPKLLQWVTVQNHKAHKAKLVRKYGAKIVQRIGLTNLRPRVALWRYTRGSRSLANTLGEAPVVQDPTPVTNPLTDADDDDDEDIPQEVEEVVELLICGLHDEDTAVRWCAAKGIGRVGARLPHAAAGEVAGSVLALANPTARDCAVHAACTALAELGRRGLLSPSQLGEAVGACVRSLHRDEPRAGGSGGGGRAARDAGCHAAWAFARAYDGKALEPHALLLARALIATACFDREINVRRAASAAFQENVGRHGMFPHGIHILTLADFQSVGPRPHAYLHIAPLVANYTDYAQYLIDHLEDLKVEHWDFAIRELAAKALHKLTFKMPEYVAETVLPKLLNKVTSTDLNVRHGAILAIGETIHALSLIQLKDGTPASTLIPQSVSEEVRKLVGSVRSRHQYRGLGGDLMRQATAHTVSALAKARAPYWGDTVIMDWLNLIEECLSHEVQIIRDKAIEALPVVIEEYLHDDSVMYDGVSSKDIRKNLIDKYCDQLASTAVNGLVLRMGFARALGSLPKFLLLEHLPQIISSLINCTKVTEATKIWAESRRDAVIGLTNVCQTLGIVGGVDTYVPQIYRTLLDCLNEYTLDMRGDIGALVREASMTGLSSVTRACASECPELNKAEVVREVMCGLAQQAVEKIDRTRAHAGRTFTTLLYHDPIITNIPHQEAIQRIFPAEEIELKPKESEDLQKSPDDLQKSAGDLQKSSDDLPKTAGDLQKSAGDITSENNSVVLWLFPQHTMPKFVQLLQFDVYRYSIVKGLIVSAGELTESLVKHTTQSLFSYLNSLDSNLELLSKICDTIIQVFADHLHVRRITGPIYNFLDRLFSSGAIMPILENKESNFAADVLKYLKLDMKGAKNLYKLLDSINVLCQLIQVGGEISQKCMCRLSVYLCHPQSYVRRATAHRLYEALTLYADESETLPQVMSILAETDWERDVTELRPIRNEICDLLGVERPIIIRPQKS